MSALQRLSISGFLALAFALAFNFLLLPEVLTS